jgi:hypothetical protein
MGTVQRPLRSASVVVAMRSEKYNDTPVTHVLSDFVMAFAKAFNAADARGPTAVSPRSGRVYQPGIGPHPEDRAVDLIVAELAVMRSDWLIALRQCYPGSRQTCDLLWGDPPEWAIEIKMFRPNGDNGKPDDTAIKDILSPFASDRSAVSDCRKIAESDIAPHRSILIYGFDDARKPLRDMIAAFETLAQTRVWLGPRHEAPIGPLVHPVHQGGAVFAWEVRPLAEERVTARCMVEPYPARSGQRPPDEEA